LLERWNSLNVIKEEIVLNNNIKKRLNNICTFASKKGVITGGSVRYIPKTNIAYIEPICLQIDNKTYIIFGKEKINYIGDTTLYKNISITELEEIVNRGNATKNS